MSVDAIAYQPTVRSFAPRLLRAWLLTALIDGTFSSVLAEVFYGSTVTRLFQGVASTLLGPKAFEGGTPTALVGVLMHFGVALGWSTVFLVLVTRSERLRRLLETPGGMIKVAALYGPFIWMIMSLVVIPTLTHRPPAITYRWWIQFFGHIPFVALPIIIGIGPGQVRRTG